MKCYTDLIQESLSSVREIFPSDLAPRLAAHSQLLLLDVREPQEFATVHIQGSINVPRGILESACDWDYEETVPELAAGRAREIVVICRSGYRSVLAAFTLHQMGYQHAVSLKTGLRGWNDEELPLVNINEEHVSIETADAYFTSQVRSDQRRPKLIITPDDITSNMP